jgi:dehydrogenase/reductase SDR family member 12
LGELSHVRRVVSELQALESKVDVLVCNAGVLLDQRVETSDGNEATFATHLLGGSYLLSQLLLPQLQKASSSSASAVTDQDKARVIFVSSGGMYATKFPDWETATSSSGSASSPSSAASFDGQLAYAYAKRGQVLLAEQLAQKHADIHWIAAHPGWVDTNAVEEAYGSAKVLFKPLRTPWQGAEGITWLMAGARSSELQNGAFYLDRQPQQKHFAGLFFREGSHTRNTPLEVQSMMDRLKEAAQL